MRYNGCVTTPPHNTGPGRAPAATPGALGTAVADAVGVLVFVALGRGSHDEGTAIGGTLEVAAPFLFALALGWVVVRLVMRRPPSSLPAGVAIWAITLVAGMGLRRTVFDRGTALPFVIVAAAFLAFVLVARRVVVNGVRARRR